MYIFKNACKSITRSSGRNILIGIIVIVIAISSSVALSIKRAATKAEEAALANLSITAQISVDRQALISQAQSAGTNAREALQGVSGLSLTELEEYAQSDSVQDFYYTLSSSIDASGDLTAVDLSTDNTTQNNTAESGTAAVSPNSAKASGPQSGFGSQGDFTIIGYSSYNAMADFVSGSSKITSGTIFDEDTSDMVCVISNELATINSLALGDSITLSNPNSSAETYTFTIQGLYTGTSTSTSTSGMNFSTSTDPSNQIYTSYNTLKAVMDQSAAVATTSTDETTENTATTALRSTVAGTYVLADATGYENFQTDAAAMGLASPYTISSSDISDYESSLVPLQNLSQFATIFVLIVLLIGGIILIAFNIFNIRERKYEVGVLTAIGMKKPKVALQFISELFLVTLVAIMIGTAAGAVASVPVADKLLESQITAQQEKTTQTQQNFGRQGQTGSSNGTGQTSAKFNTKVVDYVSDINASTDIVVIGELMGIGILLTLLSSCAAVIFILRYEPLKILSERT